MIREPEVEEEDPIDQQQEPIEVQNADETTNNELYSIQVFEIEGKEYVVSGGGDDKALLWDINQQIQMGDEEKD